MAKQEQEFLYPTIFEAVDKMTAPLAGMTRALEGFQIGAQKATSFLNPLNAALGVIGAGLSFDKMLDLGSAFENQTIKMAQTAKMMGMGGETFADAMEQAKTMIQQVNTAAAALPGEAEDYSTALEMSGTTVQQAVGDYQKTFDLIKDITAITVSNQKSAAEGAMQLNKMLNAGKGMLESQNDYSMKLIQNMRTIPGYADLTTASFNNMALDKRVELVGKMRDTFKDMIAASSSTLDAIKGASMTIFKTFTREATQPLFDGFKDGLSWINGQLMDADGNATQLGATLVHVGKTLSEMAVGGLKNVLSGEVNPALLGAGVGGAASLAGGAALPLVALGAGLADFLQRTEAVNQVMGQLYEIGNMLIAPLENTTQGIALLGMFVADLIEGLLPPFLTALSLIIEPLLFVGDLLFTTASTILVSLRPALQGLWEGIGAVVVGLGEFLGPIIKVVGFALYGLYTIWDTYLKPVVVTVIDVFADLLKGIGELLSWVGKWIGKTFELPDTSTKTLGTGESPLDKLFAAFKLPELGALKNASGAPKAPGQRASSGINQDFRFSRFEISQKFEEGFDPDRIAVAFANQLGKAGEQKMQSGFAPLFSVGV